MSKVIIITDSEIFRGFTYILCVPAADDDAGLEVRLRHRDPVEVGRLPFNRTWSCQLVFFINIIIIFR